MSRDQSATLAFAEFALVTTVARVSQSLDAVEMTAGTASRERAIVPALSADAREAAGREGG